MNYLPNDFLSSKNDVNVASRTNKQKNFLLQSWRSLTKIAGSASGSVSQRYGSANPDPYQNVMGIRLTPSFSRILKAKWSGFVLGKSYWQEVPHPPANQCCGSMPILVLIRIRGSITLTKRFGSRFEFGWGSCYFRQWPSRHQLIFF